MKKYILLLISFLSLVIPWLSLLFSFKNLILPISVLIFGGLLAIIVLVLSIPKYLKNKSDLIYLASSILALIGLFYSLSSAFIIIGVMSFVR